MFYGAAAFNSDLSGWNVANVTDMGVSGTRGFDAAPPPAPALPKGFFATTAPRRARRTAERWLRRCRSICSMAPPRSTAT